MSGTTILFIVLSTVLVFMIAAGTVGREAHRLDAVAPRVVYEIEQAVQFVAGRLPADTQGRLTFDEVEILLREHLNWMATKGLQPEKPVDQVQNISEPVVVDENTLTARLLARAGERGLEIVDDVDIVRVVDAHLAYFAAIGAVGPHAESV
ncbi:MAG: hypothetical protein EBS32_04375 [Actinobacteria bacterium]|nr:hypothetical protein [Actinomycetota bacterium]